LWFFYPTDFTPLIQPLYKFILQLTEIYFHWSGLDRVNNSPNLVSLGSFFIPNCPAPLDSREPTDIAPI
jgi:hypothetical protein